MAGGIGAICAAAPLVAQSAPPTGTSAPQPDAQPASDDIVVTGKHRAGADGEAGLRSSQEHNSHRPSRSLPRRPAALLGTDLPRRGGSTHGLCRSDGRADARDHRPVEEFRWRARTARPISSSPSPMMAARCWPTSSATVRRSSICCRRRSRPSSLSDPAPVHIWNNIAMRWTGAGPPPPRGLKASVWGQLNRNAMPESYDIVGALVVFDRDGVKGMTLDQLADYATMRGLSHTRPAQGGQPMATILSLFDGAGGSPDQLTDFDAGYLRSLYLFGAQRLRREQAGRRAALGRAGRQGTGSGPALKEPSPSPSVLPAKEICHGYTYHDRGRHPGRMAGERGRRWRRRGHLRHDRRLSRRPDRQLHLRRTFDPQRRHLADERAVVESSARSCCCLSCACSAAASRGGGEPKSLSRRGEGFSRQKFVGLEFDEITFLARPVLRWSFHAIER